MSTQPNDDKPDYLQMLMETQHNQLLQAQQDRAASAKRMTRFAEASARRIARLEEAILLMSTKHQASPENRHAAALTSDDRVNLQRFCTTDGPLYSGLFHNMEQFLNWVNAVQIFLTSKGVSHNTDKIRIVGSLLRKVNVLAFCSNRVNSLLQLSWAAFKSELFDFALPLLWRTTLRDQLWDLRLRDN
jgi:hypothetical protein